MMAVLHTKPIHRFSYVDIELTAIGSLLILAGSPEALAPFRQTTATFVMDSITEFKEHLIEQVAQSFEIFKPYQLEKT